MAFMSSTPSLSGTIYGENDLYESRNVWSDVERRYMPSWFANPSGLLAKLFQANTQATACALIEIAHALYVLSRNYTQKSVPVFKRKIKSLLTVEDEKTFDELLTEIFVGAMLAPSVSPISFEPYVPDRNRNPWFVRAIDWLMDVFTNTARQQPRSPD